MEPEFLSVDDVLEIHKKQLDAFGGIDGIRDTSLLESAVMTPQASFGGEYLHNGLFEMAAAYAFHIAENQPFLDGNKRTALTAKLVFLDINGIEIIDPNMRLYDTMISIANKEIDKNAMAELLAELTK